MNLDLVLGLKPSLGTMLSRLSVAMTLVCSAALLRADDTRLVNLSTRAQAGIGAGVLTAGFVIGPGADKPVLIRAIGPTLANYGLTGVLANPVLTIFDSTGTSLATNDNWLAVDAATMASVGAFALPSGSLDSAIVTTLAPGSYTAQVTSSNNGAGLALVEIYEIGTPSTKLANLSTRAQVGTGANTMVAGLVISSGSGPRRLLIRAAGPALRSLGVAGSLADPVLSVTDATGSVTYATNDNWGTPTTASAYNAAALSAAFTAAGAFSFAAGSNDSAVLVDLSPGSYSVQVSGVSGSTGLALAEVYDVTGFTPPAAATSGNYITTAATGEQIRYPTANLTYSVTDSGQTLQIPVNMVYVPAGSFTFGTGSSATTLTIGAYAIGKFEVTNAEYKAFLDATGSKNYPIYWTNGTYPTGKDNHPVLYVSLTDALAYCAWVSTQTGWVVTIPSSQQREKAARGPNAYLYPWGNTLDATYNSATGVVAAKCNFNANVAAYYLYNYPSMAVTYDNANSPYYGTKTTVSRIAGYDTSGVATYFSITSSAAVNGWVNHDTWTGFIYTDLFDSVNAIGGTTTPVGSYPNGVSAYGCYDMAGNVWDWTTTLITATDGAEAGTVVNDVRGGSWYATGSSCTSIGTGEGRAASGAYNTVGFRIVMTPH